MYVRNDARRLDIKIYSRVRSERPDTSPPEDRRGSSDFALPSRLKENHGLLAKKRGSIS
jgi:hypothetical protein